jgi:hypothetical protein
MAFPVFTQLECMLLEAARQHQIGSNPKTEILFCVTADGQSVIDASVGNDRGVPLTQKMTNALRANCKCRLIHNHPSESSFSGYDWDLCIKNTSIAEIVVINTSGSVFRGSVQDHVRLSAIITSAVKSFDDMRSDIEICVCCAAKFTNFDLPLRLTWTAGDLINQRLCDLSMIDYQVTYSCSDLALIHQLDVLPQIKAGKLIAQQCLP